MSTERPGENPQLDTAIDRAWREASNEGPPPHVDAAILAAARSHRRSISTWQPLAAVATVAGLAFLLVQLMPAEKEVPPPVRLERAAPAESKAAPVQEDVAVQESPARQPARANEAESRVTGVAGPAAPPAAEASVEANAAAEVAVPDTPTQSEAASNEIAADTADLAAVPAAPAARSALGGKLLHSERTSADSHLSPQSWATRVEALHRAGDLDGAAAELRAFRAAYPDADRFLPDELRAWASHIE